MLIFTPVSIHRNLFSVFLMKTFFSFIVLECFTYNLQQCVSTSANVFYYGLGPTKILRVNLEDKNWKKLVVYACVCVCERACWCVHVCVCLYMSVWPPPHYRLTTEVGMFATPSLNGPIKTTIESVLGLKRISPMLIFSTKGRASAWSQSTGTNT